MCLVILMCVVGKLKALAETRVMMNAVNDLIVDAAHLSCCLIKGVMALGMSKVWKGVT